LLSHEVVIPVVRTKEYELALERVQGINLLHCRVLVPWSPGVFKRGRESLRTLLGLYNGPLYAIESLDDPKHPKFLRTMGFSPVGRAVNEDGQDTTLWAIWPKDNNGGP
jgi:hypothetical protein